MTSCLECGRAMEPGTRGPRKLTCGRACKDRRGSRRRAGIAQVREELGALFFESRRVPVPPDVAAYIDRRAEHLAERLRQLAA